MTAFVHDRQQQLVILGGEDARVLTAFLMALADRALGIQVVAMGNSITPVTNPWLAGPAPKKRLDRQRLEERILNLPAGSPITSSVRVLSMNHRQGLLS